MSTERNLSPISHYGNDVNSDGNNHMTFHINLRIHCSHHVSPKVVWKESNTRETCSAMKVYEDVITKKGRVPKNPGVCKLMFKPSVDGCGCNLICVE